MIWLKFLLVLDIADRIGTDCGPRSGSLQPIRRSFLTEAMALRAVSWHTEVIQSGVHEISFMAAVPAISVSV